MSNNTVPLPPPVITPEMAFKGMESRAADTAQEVCNILHRTTGLIVLPDIRRKIQAAVLSHTNIEWQKATQYNLSCAAQAKKEARK